MQMQETLTGNTFDHLFSFFAIFNAFSGANNISSQLLINPTIFNFAQILDTIRDRKNCAKFWKRESVKYFSSYAPQKNGHFTHKIGLDRYGRVTL